MTTPASGTIEIVGPDGPAAQMATDEDRAFQRAATIGRAMADPKRLCVLESLADGELSVSDLSARVRCQVPNMSQHLAVLRSAGLVTTRREGSTVFYRLTDSRVLEAYQLIQAIAR
jgi:DNA-binding transcriptional ArsR family regulator